MSTDTLSQPMLFDDTPRVRQSDPETSHQAADKSQKTVGSVRDRVIKIITDLGPMAAYEMCEIYERKAHANGWPKVTHESPRKRMSELRKDGTLIDTGKRRNNREGSPEVVLAIKGTLA